jgi:hypothetical protein
VTAWLTLPECAQQRQRGRERETAELGSKARHAIAAEHANPLGAITMRCRDAAIIARARDIINGRTT